MKGELLQNFPHREEGGGVPILVGDGGVSPPAENLLIPLPLGKSVPVDSHPQQTCIPAPPEVNSPTK